MTLLITGVDNSLGECARRHFSKKYEVKVVRQETDLRDPANTISLVKGAEAILHLSGYSSGIMQDEFDLLDISAQGTYVLMNAARDAGIERVVVGSTLNLFEDYPEEYVIDETWRPMPKSNAVSLSPLMVELVAREFAREGGIEVVCLRFGSLEDSGISETDAMRAIEEALDLKFNPYGYRWGLFHIHSNRDRFSTMMLTNPLRVQEKVS